MSAPVIDTRPLPWVAKLIQRLRPDLCKLLESNKDDSASHEKWLSWLVTTGIQEYKALLHDADFTATMASRTHDCSEQTRLQYLIWQARPDVRAAFSDNNKSSDFLRWFYTHGVEEHALWHWLNDRERQRVLAQPDPWPERIRTAIGNTSTAAKTLPIPFAFRVFGANLIGYAFGQLGIGEDVRMLAKTLVGVGIPISLLNFSPGNDIPQNDHSVIEHVRETGEFAFNICCMTALENGRYYAEQGPSQFIGRYNIGYWPWELEQWPHEWRDLTCLVDEVWVSSRHTYNALAPISPVPVYIMPMAVLLGNISDKDRNFFCLPETAKLFCFAFDINSSIHRKNPQACLDAFSLAFPKTEFGPAQVGLVIKVHKPTRANSQWAALKKLAAGDNRIHIIESTLSRPDLLALYKSCDCFLSLHRAEGFGRGLAEALQLGLHVICTNYSGNTDFCLPPHADVVRYKLVNVKKGQYPYSKGQVWAQADIHHAAELMRAFVAHKRKAGIINWPQFSINTVGARYKERLEQIREQRHALRLDEKCFPRQHEAYNQFKP